MNELVYFAKGPSAEHGLKYLEGRDVATVNEACLLVPGNVQFGIFYDYEQLMSSRPVWHRIETFVFPFHFLHIAFGRFGIAHAEIPGVDDLNITTYRPHVCTDLEEIGQIIENNYPGEVVVRNTSVAGLHWLVKIAGYRNLLLFGHDGGNQYAPGLSLKPGLGYDDVHQVTLAVAEMLRRKFGAIITFYKGSP